MDDNAKSFRASRLALLRFYGSPDEQLNWQTRSLALGIDEPMEWWLEDFDPDSELFKAAFGSHELRLLEAFQSALEEASRRWPRPPYPKVEAALEDLAWQKVVEAAQKVVELLE